MKVREFAIFIGICCIVAGCSVNNPSSNDQEITKLQNQIDSLKMVLNKPNIKLWSHLVLQSEIANQGTSFSTVSITDTQLINSTFIAAYAVTDSGLINFLTINAACQIEIRGDTLLLNTAWASNINWPNPPVGKTLFLEAIQK